MVNINNKNLNPVNLHCVSSDSNWHWHTDKSHSDHNSYTVTILRFEDQMCANNEHTNNWKYFLTAVQVEDDQEEPTIPKQKFSFLFLFLIFNYA